MTGRSFSICPLASGSKGNAVLISSSQCRILVDAGLSGIQIEKRLEAIGVSPGEIHALIVTHEHTDHIRGAGVFSRRFRVPVHITNRTLSAASCIGRIDDPVMFDCGKGFRIGDIHVTPFSISHDASDPVGLTFDCGSRKIGVATDMGIVTNLVKQHLMDCNILYLESNHDPEMLINGPYPWHLKQRIKGRSGHLSNIDACGLVREAAANNLKHVILAHLSEENNTPEKAFQAVKNGLNSHCISIDVARPDRPGRVISA